MIKSVYRQNTPDLTGGTQVPYITNTKALCWTCVHSGAALELQCSWDSELILPSGAKYQVKPSLDKMIIPIVVECPQYQRGHVHWRYNRDE